MPKPDSAMENVAPGLQGDSLPNDVDALPGGGLPVDGGFFETLYNRAPLPASLTRKSDGLILAVNDAWVDLTGLQRAEVVGRRSHELNLWVDPADRVAFLAQAPDHADHVLLRLKNGQVHRVRAHVTLLTGEAHPPLLLGFLSEITREYEAEAALQKTNRELRQRVALLESGEKLARMGSWINGPDQQEVVWSAGMWAITGLEPSSTIQRAAGRGRIHPDDMPAWLAARRAMDGREVEYRWEHPDGQTRWLRSRIGRTLEIDQQQTDFGVVQDITAERVANLRQAEQLRFIQNITARAPGLMYLARLRTDGSMQIPYASDAVDAMLELDPEVLKRDAGPWFERVHADDLPMLWAVIDASSRNLTAVRIDFRVLLPRQGMRWHHVNAMPHREDDGSTLWYAFVTDVTEARLAAQAMDRQRRVLDAVREAQAIFIGAQDRRGAFEGLLAAFMDVTGSAYGFVGDVLLDTEGKPYLKTLAITDIAWDAVSKKRFQEQQAEGLEFRNLQSLLGHVLTSRETVISNSPASDPRSGGQPAGHPAMDAFLGIPVQIGGELVAMVGLANRPGGYGEQDVESLQPLLGTVRQLVLARRNQEERQRVRRQLETASALLAEKSQALQATLDSISQGLVKVDADGRVMIHNRRVLELLDLPETLMANKPTQEEVGRFQKERGDFGENFELVEPNARRYVDRGVAAGSPEHYWRKTRDGRTLEVRTRMLDDGSLVRTYTDVTPYIEVQDALRAERQRLEWVLEATRPGIWETDLVTRAMKINGRWAEMLGYQPQELEPASMDTWLRLLHPDDVGRAQARMQAHLDGHAPFYECDIRMRHRSGQWIWINDRGRVHQRDAQGRALFMSGTHLDITARVTAQEQVRALNAGLEERVAQRTAELELTLKDMEAISYSIAHDLRAPLRAVNGFASVIAEEERGGLSPAGINMFDRIVRSSRHMGQMLTDMLSLLQVVRVELTAVPVDLTALTRGVMETLAGHQPRARIELQALPNVLGDAALLRQVMLNLLDNALKYSQGEEQPLIRIGYDGALRAYYINDNGVGFDMAHAGKLFGLFQRLHAAGDIPGMGVGLAIVARIIERHHGRIWADSRPGVGTTFWWTLPPA